MSTRFFLQETFKIMNCPNEILYFGDGEGALEYLRKTKESPFLILSDVNIPKRDGFELKKVINADAILKLKSIPFIFFSTAVNKNMVTETYLLSAQGFFVKQETYDEMTDTMRAIIEYWRKCAVPNNFQ